MKKGFTLAEVLIALAVIGVVAALTMPALLRDHQKKVFVAQLQRMVNLISNSATELKSDENVETLEETYLVPVRTTDEEGNKTWDYKNAQGKFLNKYFKVARDCGTTNRKECLGEEYFSLDRTTSVEVDKFIPNYYYCVITNIGSTICMDSMSSYSHYDNDDRHGYSYVIVDINGPAGPNINGRDLFQFELYSDGKIGNSHESHSDNEAANQDIQDKISGKTCQDYKSIAGYGGNCFQHIMANGWVMDY